MPFYSKHSMTYSCDKHYDPLSGGWRTMSVETSCALVTFHKSTAGEEKEGDHPCLEVIRWLTCFKIEWFSWLSLSENVVASAHAPHLQHLPAHDKIEGFGFHPNAGITCQSTKAKDVHLPQYSKERQLIRGKGDQRGCRLADDVTDKLPLDNVPLWSA